MEFFKNQPRTIILRNEFILFRDESMILVEICLHCPASKLALGLEKPSDMQCKNISTKILDSSLNKINSFVNIIYFSDFLHFSTISSSKMSEN